MSEKYVTDNSDLDLECEALVKACTDVQEEHVTNHEHPRVDNGTEYSSCRISKVCPSMKTPYYYMIFVYVTVACIISISMLVTHQKSAANRKSTIGNGETTLADELVVSSEFRQAFTRYHQNRSSRQFGLSDAYVEINKESMKKRIEDMRLLERIRSGPCGRFEEFLAGDETTNWIVNPAYINVIHCQNGEHYRNSNCTGLKSTKRYVCNAEHPTMSGVNVTIERVGEFYGTGGYDWTSCTKIDDVGALKEQMKGRDVAYVGGMFAPVYANGTIMGFPPLHIHHAHVYPYGDPEERIDKIKGVGGDHHDVMIQSHGDTECQKDEGGISCLLNILDPGMVRVIEKSESGMSGDFEINDVRSEKGAEELPYWFEVIIMLTPYNHTMQRSTFVNIGNQCIGPGPCTYAIPQDPNSNVLWYDYTHGADGSELSSGYISNFILHMHQSMMDSAYLIRSSSSIISAIDSFRQGRSFPVILDCLDKPLDIEAAKTELFHKILAAGGSVVCEATKPSLVFNYDEEGILRAHDKRSQMNCLKDPVPLNVGDVLTVLAFNQIRPSKFTRNSTSFWEQLPFGTEYTTYQHTIFRFELSHNKSREPVYVPPSYYYYSDSHPLGLLFVTRPLDKYIHTGCPPDKIKYGI